VEFDSNRIRKGLELQLASWLDAGVAQIPDVDADEFPLPAFAANRMLDCATSPDAGSRVDRPENDASTLFELEQIPLDRLYGEPVEPQNRAATLKILQQEVAACQTCTVLAKARKQTVFGVGNPNCRLCFLGEAPGADEDRLGEPFVGAAGQLLTKIIEACKLTRNDVFILNVLKCRPPGNRTPNANEIENCWGYAIKQLEIIQPEYICCLGSVAARTLLQTEKSVGRMRQQFHQYRGSKVIVTYHPSYLLRTPSAKRHVWDDMKMLMSDMGMEL
jgi:uracil-DNA glycosylase